MWIMFVIPVAVNGLQCYDYRCPTPESPKQDCTKVQGILKDCQPKEDICYTSTNGKYSC